MSRDSEHHRNRRRRRPEQNQNNRERVERQVPPPMVILKAPVRNYDPDPVNGEPIENIVTAINHRDSNKPANFETILEQVKGSESLGPGEFVCYIGAGDFAVYKEAEENGRKTLELKKKIPYEDRHQKPVWRRELSPGISRDYEPTPEPLSSLYTQEEERAFPRLGSGTMSYMPKNL